MFVLKLSVIQKYFLLKFVWLKLFVCNDTRTWLATLLQNMRSSESTNIIHWTQNLWIQRKRNQQNTGSLKTRCGKCWMFYQSDFKIQSHSVISEVRWIFNLDYLMIIIIFENIISIYILQHIIKSNSLKPWNNNKISTQILYNIKV